jgi:integrase
MPKKRLTEEGVARLKAPAAGKQVDYFDAGMPGLVLRVNYGGAKIWRALYYVPGIAKSGKRKGQRITIPTTYKLGRYPVLKLKEAREAARAFLADPQKALAQAATGSFREVAENFIKRHVEASGLRSQDEIERCLGKYIHPEWEQRPFRELKRGDVALLLDKVEDRHGKRQADLVLAIIRKIMNWYATRDDDYVSPVVRGMRRSNGTDSRRKRILDDDEIRALWKVSCDAGTFGALVMVLLLTAQRKDKVATMKWADLKDGEWTIASEAREKGNAGSLQLPEIVLDFIERQPRIASNPYVFAVRGTNPFNNWSLGKQDLDKKMEKDLPGMSAWVLHDLRRTARSLMSRTGVRPDIAERVLGHAIPGVEGVYDRHSYSDEKADALIRLAALVETIVNPPTGNVTRLDERRRTLAGSP